MTKEISMRNQKINWLAVIVLAVAFAFPLSFALHAQARRYPNMQAALSHLQQARASLQRGAKIYNGHRERALALTEQALGEIRSGIRWANTHHR
jgi:hypothetical protein